MAREMKLNRNHIHTSRLGHSIKFEKDKPRTVPPALYGEILAIGGEFVDGDGAPAAPERANAAPLDPAQRADAILTAVKDIADINDADDFSAAGMPKQESVTKRCGFAVSKKDVAQAWQRRADEIAEGREG